MPFQHLPTGVSYRVADNLGERFCESVVEIAASMPGCRIADVGGGANPALSLTTIRELGVDYHVLDIDPVELAKVPIGYQSSVCDVTAPPATLRGFDLVITRMLAEHVADGGAFHRGVHQLLVPGGRAVHLFPTLFAVPFVVNRILPERLAGAALGVVRPRDRVQHGKFPAYYHWCHGPTRRQFRRLQNEGFAIEGYVGYFGHNYYRRLPVVRSVHRMAARMMARWPIASWTSYALVTLRAR